MLPFLESKLNCSAFALLSYIRELPRVANPLAPQGISQAKGIFEFVQSTKGNFRNVTSSQFRDLDAQSRVNLTDHSVLVVDTDALAADTGVSMQVVSAAIAFANY